MQTNDVVIPSSSAPSIARGGTSLSLASGQAPRRICSCVLAASTSRFLGPTEGATLGMATSLGGKYHSGLIGRCTSEKPEVAELLIPAAEPHDPLHHRRFSQQLRRAKVG